MKNFQAALDTTIDRLSDKNYEQSFVCFRLWLEIGQTHSKIPPDAVLGAFRAYRKKSLPVNNPFDPTAHLILRFASDIESDHILAPYNAGLRSRLCAEVLQQFFDNDLGVMYGPDSWDSPYYTDPNLVAHCINLGYVEEAVIRDHILQSLIFHPRGLYGHQAYTLSILFKIAGATLAAYADPTVVDRCFEFLKGPRNQYWPKQELIQVNFLPVKGATLGLRQSFRRSLSYGSVAGRVFLPHPYSKPGNQDQLTWTRETPLQLPS